MNKQHNNMKKHYLLTLTLLLTITAQAQDTIVLRSGDIKSVKITEVSKSQVKYLLWDYQDGPVYVQETSDILMVKYKNGNKELFSPSRASSRGSQWQKPEQTVLKREGIELLLYDRELTDAEIRDLLGPEMYETVASAQHQFGTGTFCICLGAISGAIGLISALSSSTLSEDGRIAMYCFLGLADVLLPIGFVLKGAGKGRMDWAVNEYNQRGRELSQNLSLRVSPSIVCTPTSTGIGYGLGAGLQLHF